MELLRQEIRSNEPCHSAVAIIKRMDIAEQIME